MQPEDRGGAPNAAGDRGGAPNAAGDRSALSRPNVSLAATRLFGEGRTSRTLFPASLAVLGDVDKAISGALEENGYIEKSYFGVPDGFAMVTRLEKMLPDGRSATIPSRWSVDTSAFARSASANTCALCSRRTRAYRVIVFIVTPYRSDKGPSG